MSNSKIAYTAIVATILGVIAFAGSAVSSPVYADNGSNNQAFGATQEAYQNFYLPVIHAAGSYLNATASSIPVSQNADDAHRPWLVHGWVPYVHLRAMRPDLTDGQLAYILEQMPQNPYAGTFISNTAFMSF